MKTARKEHLEKSEWIEAKLVEFAEIFNFEHLKTRRAVPEHKPVGIRIKTRVCDDKIVVDDEIMDIAVVKGKVKHATYILMRNLLLDYLKQVVGEREIIESRITNKGAEIAKEISFLTARLYPENLLKPLSFDAIRNVHFRDIITDITNPRMSWVKFTRQEHVSIRPFMIGKEKKTPVCGIYIETSCTELNAHLRKTDECDGMSKYGMKITSEAGLRAIDDFLHDDFPEKSPRLKQMRQVGLIKY